MAQRLQNDRTAITQRLHSNCTSIAVIAKLYSATAQRSQNECAAITQQHANADHSFEYSCLFFSYALYALHSVDATTLFYHSLLYPTLSPQGDLSAIRTLASAFGALFFGFLFSATTAERGSEPSEPAFSFLGQGAPYIVASGLYVAAGLYYMCIFRGGQGAEWEPAALEAAAKKEREELIHSGGDRSGMKGVEVSMGGSPRGTSTRNEYSAVV
jgi:hypothetical protein